VRRLLALAQPPTALLVDNGRSGVGALRELMDGGWRPGHGPSLIVCDSVPVDLVPYAVTAVAPPDAEDTGRLLARLVLDLLAGLPVESLQHLAQPLLKPGDTDAPLRQTQVAVSC
jgi:LacI family transcriptional regulator